MYSELHNVSVQNVVVTTYLALSEVISVFSLSQVRVIGSSPNASATSATGSPILTVCDLNLARKWACSGESKN